MEVYKLETENVLKRYASRKISYSQCIGELNAALPGVIMRSEGAAAMIRNMGSVDLSAIRNIMVANSQEAVAERDRQARRTLG
jgi:hypothetical protein